VPRLQKTSVDRGYKTTFIHHAHEVYRWKMEMAQKLESTQGLVPQKGPLAGRKVVHLAEFQT
jgi:hypothetical protein